MEKINRLSEVSKKIIRDCSLENGGIVAANSSKSYYPIDANNYMYIWLRDASYACIASDIVGLSDIQEKFYDWCFERAEGFKTTGLFYEKYYPNGLKAASRFQPDQTGTFLYTVWHHLHLNPIKKTETKYLDLVKIAADGICGVWEKDHFKIVSNDLWEERLCFPDQQENFSYSLAACIRGLRCAYEIIPDLKWSVVAEDMKARLDEHYDGFFARSFGKLTDRRIDASILGLVYPFMIYKADDSRVIDTINELEKKLSINGGIHRYENDDYDGWMTEGKHRNKGAGAWPLLNFWLSVYYKRKGDMDKAKQYYHWVLNKIEDSDYIPEQVFENDIQVSVSPLLWSHAMFIIASRELGYI